MWGGGATLWRPVRWCTRRLGRRVRGSARLWRPGGWGGRAGWHRCPRGGRGSSLSRSGRLRGRRRQGGHGTSAGAGGLGLALLLAAEPEALAERLARLGGRGRIPDRNRSPASRLLARRCRRDWIRLSRGGRRGCGARRLRRGARGEGIGRGGPDLTGLTAGASGWHRVGARRAGRRPGRVGGRSSGRRRRGRTGGSRRLAAGGRHRRTATRWRHRTGGCSGARTLDPGAAASGCQLLVAALAVLTVGAGAVLPVLGRTGGRLARGATTHCHPHRPPLTPAARRRPVGPRLQEPSPNPRVRRAQLPLLPSRD